MSEIEVEDQEPIALISGIYKTELAVSSSTHVRFHSYRVGSIFSQGRPGVAEDYW